MATISFNPEAWAVRTAGFPRLVQSILFEISLHNWRTGTAMSLAHYQIITSDLPPEQSQGIADLLLDAGKIAQVEDDTAIFSPEAIEEWQKAETLRQQRSRGGAATSGVPKPRAKPQPKPEPKAKPAKAKKSDVQPVEPAKVEVQPAPPAQEDVEAAEKINVAQQAKAQLADNVKRLAEAWNQMAMANQLSQVSTMSPERTSKAAARIKEHGIDALLTAVAAIPLSPFLMGVNDNGWKANFDWLVRPERCAKLVEGGYHITGPGNEKPSGWR